MKDQRTSYGAEDKHSLVQQIHLLDVNRCSFKEKTGPICLALMGLTAGWLAGRQNVDGSQNLYRLNYSDFYND